MFDSHARMATEIDGALRFIAGLLAAITQVCPYRTRNCKPI
jgi:hypothetical protein